MENLDQKMKEIISKEKAPGNAGLHKVLLKILPIVMFKKLFLHK
jgi:hypothetical protein